MTRPTRRVALITGGAGAIGRAVARRIARADATVILVDRKQAAVEEAAKELCDVGHPAIGMFADVAEPGAGDAVVERVLKDVGAVDLLVNNAGVMGRVAPLWELTDDDWHGVIAADLTSVFRFSRAVLPHMRSRRAGCIVSVASIAGKEGTASLIPYSVAKAGIIAFTKALAKEVVADGIRVNCVAPGVIETPLLDQLPADSVQAMLSRAPMGRFGTPDEVAAVVHFLSSPEASFVTAQCYDVSGGRATY